MDATSVLFKSLLLDVPAWQYFAGELIAALTIAKMISGMLSRSTFDSILNVDPGTSARLRRVFDHTSRARNDGASSPPLQRSTKLAMSITWPLR
eukprot:7006931-Pyramimonas_sp.AAC.1